MMMYCKLFYKDTNNTYLVLLSPDIRAPAAPGRAMGRVRPLQVHGAVPRVLRDGAARDHRHRGAGRHRQLRGLLLHHQGPAGAALCREFYLLIDE